MITAPDSTTRRSQDGLQLIQRAKGIILFHHIIPVQIILFAIDPDGKEIWISFVFFKKEEIEYVSTPYKLDRCVLRVLYFLIISSCMDFL